MSIQDAYRIRKEDRHDYGPEVEDWAEPPYISLPHECGDWVVGGVEDARELIADLQRAIDTMEGTI